MKIVDVYSPKGGVSKSTLATNIAAGYVGMGKKVCVLDTDEQKSVARIFKNSESGFDVFVGAVPSGYDVCIVDHHPSHKTKPKGDFVILPLRPSRPDFEAFKNARTNIKGKPFLMVVTQLDNRIADDKVFRKHMQSNYNALTMESRNVYRRAFADSKTVFDMGSAYRAREARNEIKKIIEVINNVA